MLYPQIPHEPKKRITTEFKGDAKIASASRKVETETDRDLYTQLEEVVNFLREFGDVSTLGNPGEWVEGVLDLVWIEMPIPAFYVSTCWRRRGDIVFGMGGSSDHLLGSRSSNPSAITAHPSLLAELDRFLMSAVSEGLEEGALEHPEHNTLRIVEQLSRDACNGVPERLEFLARTLASGTVDGVPVVLTTPLYIALARPSANR